jgi:hypothetical protein
MPLNSLVVQVQPGHDSWLAIEGVVVCVGSGSGVVGGSLVIGLDVEKGVDSNHVSTHDIGSLEDLRSDVY